MEGGGSRVTSSKPPSTRETDAIFKTDKVPFVVSWKMNKFAELSRRPSHILRLLLSRLPSVVYTVCVKPLHNVSTPLYLFCLV